MIIHARLFVVALAFCAIGAFSGKAHAQPPSDTFVQILIPNSSSATRGFVSFKAGPQVTDTVGPGGNPIPPGGGGSFYVYGLGGASGTLTYDDCVLQFGVRPFSLPSASAGSKCTLTTFSPFPNTFTIFTLELTN